MNASSLSASSGCTQGYIKMERLKICEKERKTRRPEATVKNGRHCMLRNCKISIGLESVLLRLIDCLL